MPMALELLPLGDRCPESSLLLVACNICPRAQIQFQAGEPLYSWRMLFGKANAFVRHLRALETEAIRAGIVTAHLKTSPTSAMCLWSEPERSALSQKSQAYDILGVIGCDSAMLTARRAVPNKPILPLARTKGIANYTLRSRSFFTIEIVAGEVARTVGNGP